MKPPHQNQLRVIVLVGAMGLAFGVGLALIRADWLGSPPPTPVNLRGAESAMPQSVIEIIDVTQLTGTLLAEVPYDKKGS